MQQRRRQNTLKQHISLCLGAAFLALVLQICLNFYQSGIVLGEMDRQMGNFNAISSFQGGVERSITALEGYRWEFGDTDELLDELHEAASITNAWLWRIDSEIDLTSEEQNLLYQAVDATYSSYMALLDQLRAQVAAGEDDEASRLYYSKIAPCGGYLRQYTQQLLNQAIVDAKSSYVVLSAQSNRIRIIQSVVTGLCIVLCWVAAREVLRMLTPVQQMITASRAISRGAFDTPDIPIPGQTELGQLAEAFNRMKHSMAQQMNTLREKGEIERELHRQKTQALELQNRMERSRMQQLRSQIDPHFLFNTLNVILQTAGQEKAYRTQALITALSHLLRYSLMS
ncbi:MAG: sensor histidine kinase, partial [Faecalibacterium sp.]